MRLRTDGPSPIVSFVPLTGNTLLLRMLRLSFMAFLAYNDIVVICYVNSQVRDKLNHFH